MTNDTIHLVNDTIDKADINALIDWLSTYPRLTKGPVTLEFEKKWSQFLGTNDSIFVNSGSSANLLVIQALIEMGKLNKGDKVVIPSLAWATDLAPVVQLGLTPVLCDCNLEDLSLDLEHLQNIFSEHDIKALMFVSVLGLVPKMNDVVDLCNSAGVLIIEDTCEAFGSQADNKMLGTFGFASTFSTYFGHHLSTIEGGIISSDNEEFCDIVRAIRSHGWDRDVSPKLRKSLRQKWEISDFDGLYTFYYHGFNVRSTDLQAFIGVHQLDKANDVIEKRHDNFIKYQKHLENSYWKPMIRPNSLTSNFAYPIISPKRDNIVKKLVTHNVEVRPMICRSMGSQPFYKKLFGEVVLPNAALVDQYGMYVPNNPALSDDEIEKICDMINEVIHE